MVSSHVTRRAAKLPESSAILFMNSFESPSKTVTKGLFNFKTRPRPHKAIGEVKVLWQSFFLVAYASNGVDVLSTHNKLFIGRMVRWHVKLSSRKHEMAEVKLLNQTVPCVTYPRKVHFHKTHSFGVYVSVA